MSLASLLLSFLLLQSLNVSLSIRTATCTRYRLSTQQWNKFLMKRDPKGQLSIARYSNLLIVLHADHLACSGMWVATIIYAKRFIVVETIQYYLHQKVMWNFSFPTPSKQYYYCATGYSVHCFLWQARGGIDEGSRLFCSSRNIPLFWWQSFNNFVVNWRFSRPNSIVVTHDTNFLHKIILDLRHGY